MGRKYEFEDLDHTRMFLREYGETFAVGAWNGTIAPNPEDLDEIKKNV